MTTPDIHSVRQSLADDIVRIAAQCNDNDELLSELPILTGQPLHLLGEGSTRRAWGLPFGLVLKLERSDKLTPQEMERRGSPEYLRMRRRGAIFNEFITSVAHPALTPRVYGVLLAFGVYPVNPAVLIVEHVKSIAVSRVRDFSVFEGVKPDDLYICSDTGQFLITDPKINPQVVPVKPHDIPYRKIAPGSDESVHLSNIGKVGDRYYLLDSGGLRKQLVFIDERTFFPVGLDRIGCRPPAHWSIRETTAYISFWLFKLYQSRSSEVHSVQAEVIEAVSA